MWSAAIAGAVLLLIATRGAAGTPAQDCAAAKLKAAGKKAAAVLNCHRKAAKLGAAIDPACVTPTDEKLQTLFGRAEAKGGCAVSGDEPVVRGQIDQWVTDLATLLRPSTTANACAGLKLRVTGKKVLGKLRCHSSALRRDVATDAECLAKVEQKYQERFAAAEASPP